MTLEWRIFVKPMAFLMGGVGLLSILLLSGCSGGSQASEVETIPETQGEEEKSLQVVTSFYPLYEFASQVGGDRVDVHNLVPAGVEPHDWEPSPKDVQRIANADLFVYNGAGLEPWIETFLLAIDESRLVVVNASAGVPLINGLEDGHNNHDHAEKDEVPSADLGHEHAQEEEHEEEHAHDAEESHGEEAGEALQFADPHIWLDPVRAQQMVQNILNGYKEADPEKSNLYEVNAQEYTSQLASLDQDFAADLQGFKGRVFITSHAAFGYLADRYGLVQKPILGLAPDAEPSPAVMAEVTRFAKANEVRVIFFESLVSPKVSQVLANEVGAETLPLNPIEGLTKQEVSTGESYVSLMRQNLQNLRYALED